MGDSQTMSFVADVLTLLWHGGFKNKTSFNQSSSAVARDSSY